MDYYEKDETSSWRDRRDSTDELYTSGCLVGPCRPGRRRPRSNFIYPIRAPSDVDRDSPPPPYVMFSSPPPSYAPRTELAADTHDNHTEAVNFKNYLSDHPFNLNVGGGGGLCFFWSQNIDVVILLFFLRKQFFQA